MDCNWKKTSLADVSEKIDYGFTASATDKNTGTKFLRITDIQNGFVQWRDVPFCEIDSSSKLKYLLTDGDIVVARTGNSTGENYLFQGESFAVFASYLIRFRLNKEIVDPSYVWRCMRSASWWNFVRGSKTGSAQAGANAKVLGRFEFEYPPLHEQKAIAEIFRTLDEKIELIRNNNETLEEIAKALFKSWFVDFDPVKAKMEGHSTGLPDEINDLFPDSFEDSDLGEIPDRWSTVEVGSICECVGGGTPSTKEPLFWENGNNFWATPKDLSDLEKPFLLGTSKKITNLGIQKISSRVLPIGTVLISSRAPVGYVAVAEVPLSINQGFIAIKPSEILSKEYLLNWAQANVEKFKNRASGTTFAEISKKSFRPIKILLPDEKVMGAFSDITKIIYKRIISSMKEIKNLVDIRDILLPKLISGEISISNAEKMIDEVGIYVIDR